MLVKSLYACVQLSFAIVHCAVTHLIDRTPGILMQILTMCAHEPPLFNAMWSIEMSNYANGTRALEMAYPTCVQLSLLPKTQFTCWGYWIGYQTRHNIWWIIHYFRVLHSAVNCKNGCVSQFGSFCVTTVLVGFTLPSVNCTMYACEVRWLTRCVLSIWMLLL